jgi:hypothetical protein
MCAARYIINMIGLCLSKEIQSKDWSTMYRRGNLIFCLEVRPITEFSKEFISHSGKDFVICLDNNLENLVDFSSFPATHLENTRRKQQPGFWQYLKTTKTKLCRIVFTAKHNSQISDHHRINTETPCVTTILPTTKSN